MSDTKRKTFDAVVREVGARVLRFVISTGSRDREGDTINPRGWKLSAFKANPVILRRTELDERPCRGVPSATR